MALVAMAFMVVAKAAMKTITIGIRAVLQLGAAAVVARAAAAAVRRVALLLMAALAAPVLLALDRLALNPVVAVVAAGVVTRALVARVA
jgi:hypothetical protein